MSTFEGLPDDTELLSTFPEGASFLAAGGVALDAMMSTLQYEQAEERQARFDTVRGQFDVFWQHFSTEIPITRQWQSFHKLTRPDGQQRLWVLNDVSNSLLRVVSNDEVRDGGSVTLNYQEFAVHPTKGHFGRRTGTARMPAGASGWKIPDLGTCALIEHGGNRLNFFRGQKSGLPLMIPPQGALSPIEQLDVDDELAQGLGALEQTLNMFVGGSCYEAGVTGNFR